MKKRTIGGLIVLAASALTLMGQSAGTANPQVLGRGRGGAPYAWGDKNKDGICDITGNPVGQGRGPRMASRGGRGQAWGGRMGRGLGRAAYGWRAQSGSPATPPAQAAPSPAK